MDIAAVNGIELEFEVVGSGPPLLLISPVLADGFLPLLAEPAVADRFQIVRYHKRGWAGSSHTEGPVTVEEHAGDAAALLEHLGLACAHVAGHSSGAAVAAQLALDRPEVVRTLLLLELSLLSVPLGEAFFEQAVPAFAAYGSGDHERAIARFMTLVSGLEWPDCRDLMEARAPGSTGQAVKDADTFFGVELPGLVAWSFGAAEAAAIGCPVLSVLGGETHALWQEVADFLRASLDDVEDCTIEGVGHLLHLQDPRQVAEAMAAFLARHPVPAG